MTEPQPLVRFFEVAEGEVLPTLSIRVSAEDADSYGQAVGSHFDQELVSPTLLLAFAMAEMTAVMPLPATTLHVGQELTLRRAVHVDEQLEARFVLHDRRESPTLILHRFNLEISVDGEIVADGRIGLQTSEHTRGRPS
jgi:acyl dehydratase